MFNLGWSELLIVSAVTIVVVGPKEIPRVLRTVMTAVRKARSYASDFQRSIMDVADMEDIKDIKDTLLAENESLESEITDALDMDGIRKEWDIDWDEELAIEEKDSDVISQQQTQPKKKPSKKTKARKTTVKKSTAKTSKAKKAKAKKAKARKA